MAAAILLGWRVGQAGTGLQADPGFHLVVGTPVLPEDRLHCPHPNTFMDGTYL